MTHLHLRIGLDLRDAWRGLRGGRGTTTLAFLILTLTMAAGTVTFSVVDAVALRPLPYGSPERLVSIMTPSSVPGRGMPVSPESFFDWQEGARAFESIGAARVMAPLEAHIDGVVETLSARRVTANLFDVLGVRPALGRFFGPEHARPGGPTGVILSHALWVRRFRADPSVIGRLLTVGGEQLPIVGILPREVAYPITLADPPDLYLPYVQTAAERTNSRGYSMFVVGRLSAGVSFVQGRADIERLGGALVVRLHDQVVGPAKTSMSFVLTAVAFVLLVACVSVASLLLARAATRTREFATREVMGASHWRLAWVQLLEGLMLSLASALAAVVLSYGGVELARSLLPPGLTRTAAIAVNARVLSVSIAVAVLCGLAFSIAPSWLTARTSLLDLIKDSGGPLIGGRRRDRALFGFLAANVAFVSVLLVATTLVVTSFRLITTADLGFDRENAMSIWYQHVLGDVPEADRPAAVTALRADLIARAKSVGGVTHAAITDHGAPLQGTWGGLGLTIPGFGPVPPQDVLATRVTSEYFSALGIPLVRGRLFEPADRLGTPDVMLINDVAARRYFPDRDPIGQVVTVDAPTTIVGVVKGTRFFGPEADVRPEFYRPLAQKAYRDIEARELGQVIAAGGLVVRTSRDPRRVEGDLRGAIGAGGTLLPIPTRFVADDFRRLTAGRRFNAWLMAMFGFVGSAIGAVGIYGTMAFVVARQVPAIGLRLALGATPGRVGRSVVAQALRRVAFGVGIGLTIAWTVSAAFASLVFGVRPTEPAVYVSVAGFLVLVGATATLVPALRAARLDPLTALRRE